MRNLIRSLWFVALMSPLATPAFALDRAIAWQGNAADGKVIRFDPQHLQHPAILLFWAT